MGLVKQVEAVRWETKKLHGFHPFFLFFLMSYILVGSFTALEDSSWSLSWRLGVAFVLTTLTYLLCRGLLD
jgi:hypothetical protein